MINPFKRKGVIIAIEGIDGAGKTTQARLLGDWFDKNLLPNSPYMALNWSFPRYSSSTGKLIQKYLKGELDLETRETALLYAYNKYDWASPLKALKDEGNIIIVDRYVYSNLAYQTARVPQDKKKSFRKWLSNLEFKVNGMPKPDFVIQYKPRLDDARNKAEQRNTLDIYEDDFIFQGEVAKEYEVLKKSFGKNWIDITVFPNSEMSYISQLTIDSLLDTGRFDKFLSSRQGWSVKPVLKLLFW